MQEDPEGGKKRIKNKKKIGRYLIQLFINLNRQDEFKIETQDKDKCQMEMQLSLSFKLLKCWVKESI